jgi:NAD(P)-dependent dehydrogenase (short-subunit alcohol dehydrogenase family)
MIINSKLELQLILNNSGKIFDGSPSRTGYPWSNKECPMKIANNVFIVTGAASGLGNATAKMLAEAGAKVVMADLKEPAELLPNMLFHKTDVADEASGAACIDAAKTKFGELHGLINCAGVAPSERVVGKTGPHGLESFSRTIGINLIGSFNMMRLAAAAMSTASANEEGERGVIINTASVAAYDGQIGQAAYSASKGGIVGMTLPAARELARFGIRVMAIAPGIFETPMLMAFSQEVRDSLGATVPFPPRLGRPAEYAALARHIIENPMLNGEVIRLDGALRMTAK